MEHMERQILIFQIKQLHQNFDGINNSGQLSFKHKFTTLFAFNRDFSF